MTGDVIVHIYEMPGDYNVTLYAHNDCGQDSLTQVVVVGEPPLAAWHPVRPILLTAPGDLRLPCYI